MDKNVPQREWREIYNSIPGLQSVTEIISSIPIAEVDSIRHKIEEIFSKWDPFFAKISRLRSSNLCFKRLVDHDAGTFLKDFQSCLEGLRFASSDIRGTIEHYYGTDAKFYDKDFRDSLYREAKAFCAADKSVESVSAEFRTLLGHLGREVDYVLDLWDKVNFPSGEEEVDEIIEDFFDLPDIRLHDQFYSDLYREVLEFCTSVERPKISSSLREKMVVLAGEEHFEEDELDPEMDEVRGAIREILAKVAFYQTVILDTLFGIAAVLGSSQFWVEGENLEAEQVDVSGLLQNLKGALDMSFGVSAKHPDRAITFEVDTDLRASAHPGTVGNLLLNMCTNAKNRGRAKLMLVRAYSSDDSVIIEVSDNGSGVEESIVGSIFEEGFTTHTEGTGLGLGSAKERMAVFGGGIECDGHGGIDGGAKFKLSFPSQS